MNNFIFFFNYCLTVTIMHNNATIIKNGKSLSNQISFSMP